MLVNRYQPILLLQYFLLFEDLFMNSFVELLRFQNVILVVLHVIQDICIVFAVIMVFLLFLNTYIFQAGLVSILISKFKATIIIIFVYFCLSVGLHSWGATLRWEDVNRDIWSPGYRALYAIQRIGAIFYYYFYKRTALRLSNPQFYEDSDWIRQEFEKRRTF